MVGWLKIGHVTRVRKSCAFILCLTGYCLMCIYNINTSLCMYKVAYYCNYVYVHGSRLLKYINVSPH